MGELASALDALSAVDLDELGDAELLARARELVVAAHRVHAELTRVVRRTDVRGASERDGARTARAWLRGVPRISGAWAGDLVRHGRALESLPATARAYAEGWIGPDQVDVIAVVVAPAHLDLARAQGIDVGAVEAALVQLACVGTHRQLQQAVGEYLARLDPDGAEPDPTTERAVTLVQHPDGSWTIGGHLDAVGGQRVATALESVQAASRCAGDERTRAQRTGDALVQLADDQLAGGDLPVLRGTKPQVVVTVPLSDLTGSDTSPGAARTSTGATVSAARARWVACDAGITRVVLDPDGLPLDVGRTQRIVPPHIRRAAELRDAGCVFAGCEAPVWFCDVHHLLHWAHGGETSLGNSALLCERHHTKVHHGYRVQRVEDRWRTWRPDGTEILVAAGRLRT